MGTGEEETGSPQGELPQPASATRPRATGGTLPVPTISPVSGSPPPPELGCWKRPRGLGRAPTAASGGDTAAGSRVCRRTKQNRRQRKKKPLRNGRLQLACSEIFQEKLLLWKKYFSVAKSGAAPGHGAGAKWCSWDGWGCPSPRNHRANCEQMSGKAKGFLIMKVLLVT